jgi:hypothetical protein
MPEVGGWRSEAPDFRGSCLNPQTSTLQSLEPQASNILASNLKPLTSTSSANHAGRFTRHASRFTLPILLGAIALLLAACASPSKLRSDYGVAIESAKHQQTMRFVTDGPAEAVRGLDGRVADAVMKQYRQSFEQAQTQGQPPAGAPAEGMSFGGPPVNPVVP